VSRADEGGESDFQVPSHLRREQVVVAISTGGASPLLARRIGERLDDVVTAGLGRAAGRLAEARADVQARWAGDEARRRAFWFSLITPEFLDLAIQGEDEEVERAIARCLSQS
jgi:siroheme synthase-like protein